MRNLYENYLKLQESDIKPIILGEKVTLAKLKPENPRLMNRYESSYYGYIEVIECEHYIAVVFPKHIKLSENDNYIYLTNLSLKYLIEAESIDVREFVKIKI